MQLIFTYSDRLQGYGYQLLLQDNDQWRPVSAHGNPLVRGASFDLYPQKVDPQADGSLKVAGTRKALSTDGKIFEYPWTGKLKPDPKTGWLGIQIQIDSLYPIALQMAQLDGSTQDTNRAGIFEPEITIDLGLLPPYERGDHVWYKTSLTNPTKWNDEAYGNDFPGTYYYDPYLKLELLMFFDMTAMSWMGFENIARFLNYRCGFRRRYRPLAAAEVGLYADGFSGKQFSAGKQSFAYWITARPRGVGSEAPTEQEAVTLLIQRCLELVPAHSHWPAKATSWKDFSLGCARDMADSSHAWGRNDEVGEFIINYVDGLSTAWDQVARARGQELSTMIKPCLESAVWAAYPLASILLVDSTPEYHLLQVRLLAFIQRMQAAGKIGVLGGKPSEFSAAGTWQYVYLLEEFWQVARAQSDRATQEQLLQEVDQVLVPMARRMGYLFSLIFDKQSLDKVMNGDGNAIIGLYAYFMLELYQAYGVASYFEEAKQSLRVYYYLPVNTILQEAFLTSCGVQAACSIYSLTGEEEYARIYHYLLAQVLRLVYWFSDRTTEENRLVDIRGMVHACTPIIYAALFENIDTLARLTPTFKVFPPSVGLLRLLNHARKDNFYCYPQCLPEQWQTSPLKYIPHENIPLLEGPNQTPVGQEIYGAGFTFRAYLVWEALGHCTDRDIMVLNLDNYDELDLLQSEAPVLHFLVFNPEPAPKQAALIFPPAQLRPASYIIGPIPTMDIPESPLHDGRIDLTLQPDQILYITIAILPSSTRTGSDSSLPSP